MNITIQELIANPKSSYNCRYGFWLRAKQVKHKFNVKIVRSGVINGPSRKKSWSNSIHFESKADCEVNECAALIKVFGIDASEGSHWCLIDSSFNLILVCLGWGLMKCGVYWSFKLKNNCLNYDFICEIEIHKLTTCWVKILQCKLLKIHATTPENKIFFQILLQRPPAAFTQKAKVLHF